MAYLTDGVVLSCVLGLINLTMTFAVIRWMGRSRQPSGLGSPGFDVRGQRLPAGAKVPDVTVTTVNGETRSISDMAGGRSVIGFMTPGCPPCRTQLEPFIDFARTVSGGASQVLAVVIGNEARNGEAIREYVDALDGAAAVSVEPSPSPAAEALSVTGFPTFYVIGGDGHIQASSSAVRRVAMLATAQG